MSDKPHHIAIVGAGPVGSLLSIYLAKRGHRVSVFERRPDLRKINMADGRSINLALSSRGIRALEDVGLAEEVKKAAIPMNGRMMHDIRGGLTFQPYGKQGQFINSISRSGLNIVLINTAEKAGVKFHFGSKCVNVNLSRTEITLQTPSTTSTSTHQHTIPSTHPHTSTSTHPHINTSTQSFDLIVGADGAFSSVRGSMQMEDRFNFSKEYIEHGYKEFYIPCSTAGEFLLEKNALHIWPRESFMMIALPNPDGSFTCTLFFPWEGNPSFQSLTPARVTAFFSSTFPDAAKLMANYLNDYSANPASSLVSIACWPWVKNKTLLIGDAAHAIVPFYGQGMNAGFEDCRILNQLLDQHNGDWDLTLPEFQQLRKPDADAIAQLALDNFVEMRDLVADKSFLLQKTIEAKLHELYPLKWIPLYSMVTFHDQVRYSEAYVTGQKQRDIMRNVMRTPGIAENWRSLNFKEIVDQLKA